MVSREFLLRKCIEFKVLEAKRYQESCQIYCLLNWFLNKEKIGSLLLIEREPLREKDGKKEEIDTIIKLSDQEHYDLLELKTSIRDEKDIIKTLKQLEERDDNFLYDKKKIDVKNLILLCHEDDVREIKKIYDSLLLKKELNISRPVVFLTWKVSEDSGCMENYYIKYYGGNHLKDNFIEEIKKTGIKKQIIQTIIKSETERYYFTNVKPCLTYLYFRFKSYINQKISSLILKPTIKDIISIGKMEDLVKEFKYKLGNKLVAPRSKWIKDAINFFDKLKWLKVKDDGSIEIIINKFRSMGRHENDEFKYFANIICREERAKFEKLEKKRLSKLKKEERKKERILKRLSEGNEKQQTLF